MQAIVWEVQQIEVGALAPSKTNTRKDQGDLKELAASIKANGILQPLIVKSVQPETAGALCWEIVAGERRWRAAKIVKLGHVPCVQLNMDQATAIGAEAVQIVENLQRKRLNPIEEGNAFSLLMAQGARADQIARQVGVSTGQVHQRALLVGLPTDISGHIADGRCAITVGVQLARVHSKAAREVVSAELIKDAAWDLKNGAGIPTARALELIATLALRGLDRPPFNPKDPNLVAGVPGCAECPKRTDAQRDLFGEPVFEHALCLDSACYRSKAEATYRLDEAKATERHKSVLSARETANAFDKKTRDLKLSGDYEDLEGSIRNDATLRKQLGGDLPQVYLAQDPKTGGPIRLVARKDVESILKAPTPDKSNRDTAKGADARRKVKAATFLREFIAAQMMKAFGRGERLAESAKMIELLTETLVRVSWSDTVAEAAKMAGWEAKYPKADARNATGAEAYLLGQSPMMITGYLVACTSTRLGKDGDVAKRFDIDAKEVYRVHLEKLRAEAKEAEREKRDRVKMRSERAKRREVIEREAQRKAEAKPARPAKKRSRK